MTSIILEVGGQAVKPGSEFQKAMGEVHSCLFIFSVVHRYLRVLALSQYDYA